MAKQNPALKLTIERIYLDEQGGHVPLYNLRIYNIGPSDVRIVEIGTIQRDHDSKVKKVPLNPPLIMEYLLIPAGEDYQLRAASGYQQKPIYYVKDEHGLVAVATKHDRRIEYRTWLVKLSKRLNPRHKVLPPALTATILATVIILVSVLLAWLHIITSRPSYEAIGTILVATTDSPKSYYKLQVGSLSGIANANTDTISVSSAPSHWYSIDDHTTYSVNSATTQRGQPLTFYDYVVDRVHHKAYSIGPGCTISKTPTYCTTEDGTGYYVKLGVIGDKLPQ